MSNPHAEFTRSGYRRLLRHAKSRYRFISFHESESGPGSCIWRHDVDMSPQAAKATGIIEANEGVSAIYFFNLRSPFYNLFEASVIKIVHFLHSLGHEIGLHFDASILETHDAGSMVAALEREKGAFEALLQIPSRAFSFHNPGEHTKSFTESSYAGMVNAYSTTFASNFSYCSDSNGYWRFTPLESFINAGHPSIYVLTHPEWWTPRAMAPRARVVRAVRGRAKAVLADYDERMQRAGRKNVR
ncbi:MAG TPA: hypothetical protein PLS03_06605 [Terrimicrobiaceae bacterium]|nr:hypothetical protein [Terrimicrobiaceae bacterium]